MNTYRNYEYEVKNEGNGWQCCTIMFNGEVESKFEFDSPFADSIVKGTIDGIIRGKEIDNYIRTNKDLCDRLAKTYEKRNGYGSWQESQMRQFINKNYKGDAEAFTKKLFKTVVSRENSKLRNTIDHLTDMSMIEFRRLIEKLTEHKVCVNGGKSYLHIYNWYFKNGERTRYRTDNYYISVGQNLPRTEENAKMIAAKCLEFAKIENYGYKAEIPVEKF
jgi:hypothetical protein